jgi:hypothetical protein
MNPAAAPSAARVALPCVRFPDAPDAEWKAAMALLSQAVSLAGIPLPPADGRLERQDASKVMAALIDLGGQMPRGLERDERGLESLPVGQPLGSR